MRDTVFRNAYMMYPQDRNLHGNIFGGHILRRAFEAARVTASAFFGTEDKVAFQAVDEIQFVKPIPVGSIVEFTSTVSYSELSACVVNVTAAVVDVSSGTKDTTNSFNYMFSVPIRYVDRKHMMQNSIICTDGSDSKDRDRLSFCTVMNAVETGSQEKIDTEEYLTTSTTNPVDSIILRLPRVVPREYFEIVKYLDGRRSLRHMLDAKSSNDNSTF